MSQKQPNEPSTGTRPAPPPKPPARTPVLTLSAATRAMAALAELHRVCLGMDLERQAERPTEEEYQAAMAEAAGALKGWAPHEKRKDG